MAALDRFVEAQAGGVFERAVAEVRDGRKRGHWMWFIFPQIAGLGHSETARFYSIADRAEARDYLAHPLLGPRLREAVHAMVAWRDRRSAQAILGGTDALKLASSMTLFEAVAEEPGPFAEVLDAFCTGERDRRTLDLLGS